LSGVKWAFAFSGLVLPLLSATAQSRERPSIRGTVSDTAGTPLDAAEVLLLHSTPRAVSDSLGRFQITGVDSGIATLVARKFGFVPETTRVSVASGASSSVRFALRPAPAVLGEVTVRDSAHRPPRFDDFERRRARRMGGQYITQADIERRQPRVTSDILRGALGIKIVDSAGVTLAVSSRGPKTSVIAGGLVPVPCVMRIGVDGAIKEPYFPINSIAPKDIYGIEIQHSANMPPEFGGAGQNAFCGLVMIWTK
jgi:hypothetical protein